MQEIIGVNLGGHDASATYLRLEQGKIAEIQIHLAERLTKLKHQGLFPYSSLRSIFQENPQLRDNLSTHNVALNCFGTTPEELEKSWGETHKDLIGGYRLEKVSSLFNQHAHFFTHHIAHAYSALVQCPYDEALIVVVDGAGNWPAHFPNDDFANSPQAPEVMSAYTWKHQQLRLVRKEFSHLGLGKQFEQVSRSIFGDWIYAGKVMGLAAYGQPSTAPVQEDWPVLKSKQAFDQQAPELFQLKANFAASMQQHFEEEMLLLIRNLKEEHPSHRHLILVGGCALNCLLNDRVIRDGVFEHVFIPPFPNDEGISVGAALALAHQRYQLRFPTTTFENLHIALSSPSSDTHLQQTKVADLFAGHVITRPTHLCETVAQHLANGEIIAWVQGKSEVGPRALGQRSILARPDLPDMKQRLNDQIKFRESFRPYGATLLQEQVATYFEVKSSYQSPFMTFSPKVRSQWLGKLPAVTHADGTCRIQTLMRSQNPKFYDLIQAFDRKTGLGVLLNTSLNIMGQPILESIEDAALFFNQSAIRIMVFGDYVIVKN